MSQHVSAMVRDEQGSSVVEFAMLVPLFALIVFGIFHMMFLVYSSNALHWTVEQAARCSVISRSYATAPVGDASLGCQTIAATQSYASSIYKGPRISPTFTASENTACNGRKVHAAGAYPLRAGPVNISVPVTADACFPTRIDPGTPWS